MKSINNYFYELEGKLYITEEGKKKYKEMEITGEKDILLKQYRENLMKDSLPPEVIKNDKKTDS